MSKKKSSGGIFFIVLLVLIGGGIGAMHFTGNLQPVIDKIKGTPEAPPPVEKKPVKNPVEKKPAAPAEKPVEKKPVVPAEKPAEKKPVVPAEKPVSDESDQAAKYRAKFKPPKIGSKIKIYIKSSKKPRIGILKSVNPRGIVLKMEKMELSLTRGQLSQISRARCFEDDFVKYMIARDSYVAEMERKRKARLEKMKADYLAMMAKKKGSTGSGSSGSSSNVSINDIDFKKYMEENGATDLLKKRQERIKEYERQRAMAARSK